MTKLKKNKNVTKLKKLKFWRNAETQIGTKLKETNCERRKKVTKLKNSNCDTTQKTQIVTKLKNSNCDGSNSDSNDSSS